MKTDRVEIGMFYMTWTAPAEVAGTLRLREDPRRRGLGVYEDVDGVRWDVVGIRGELVNARRVDHHPSYYSTSTFASQGGFHRWEPYEVEVVPRG